MGTWEYDVAADEFTFNEQYYRLHGLTAAEAGGLKMSAREFATKWVHSEDAHTMAEVIRRAVETTDPDFETRLEGRILRRDDQPRWVTVWFRIEKDADGRTVRLLGVNQDIHDRKLAETEVAHARDQLARSLRFTESLLAAIPTPVFFKDTAGRWFESTISILVDKAGSFSGAVFGSRDITERKRLEEQFREAQKLESIGRLAAGVAHDLNNMLTPILGYADLLLRDFHELHQRRARAEQILRGAEGARDLTRRLLAFSRRQVLSLRVVDLRQVVTGMEKLLRRTLRENLALKLGLGGEPCAVKADAGQLEQVIMNLALNAQDAMPDGGRLLIETNIVDLEAGGGAVPVDVTPGRHAMLTVTDTGCGMDAATRARVFEPFFTTKEPGRGTGLGLASVYGIVKQHKGAIWVDSEPQRPPLRGRRGETVMVAEDNAMVRDLVVSALQSLGCEALAAASGRECLETLARHEGEVHLLLTDVIMPDLNGRKLHAEVARRHPDVKVLFMSGYADDVIGHHGVLDAGVSYLQKPFAIDALLAKLREVLDAGGAARD